MRNVFRGSVAAQCQNGESPKRSALSRWRLTWARRRHLLAYVFGGYKWQIAALMTLGFLSGILGGLGIGVVIPLFSFTVADQAFGSDFVSQVVSQTFGFFGLEPTLRVFLILISALFIVKAIVTVIFGRVTIKISSDYERQTVDRLYRLAFSADWPFLRSQKIGHLQNLLTVSVPHGARLILAISSGFLNFANFLIFLIVALKLSVAVTLVALALGIVVLISSRTLLKRSRVYARARAGLNADIAHEVNENMTGLKVIKATGVERYAARLGSLFFENMSVLRVRGSVIKIINAAAIEPVSIIFIIVLFAALYHRPQFELGVFIVIVYSIHKIFTYVNLLQDMLHSVSDAFPYVQQMVAFEEAVTKHQEIQDGKRGFRFDREVEFRRVSFTYGSRTVPALADVSFTVRRGEMVGIIGPSGAGKTTLTDLLLRLFAPSDGGIMIDGINAGEIDLDGWRSQVGYVPQDTFLKNDTIANNIRFYDEAISDAEVEAAARTAYLGDVLARLPQGLATVVGERGVRLSGGERQRIALARALARSPQILVLDEATSALDHESEAMIQNAILNLRGDKTIIAIAHRLSTITHADRLVILREGRVVEQGKPSELLKNVDSYFYKAHQITVT